MAKTIIDALIVTLGLDAKGFAKGQREAVEALDKTKKSAVETDKVIRTGHAKTTRAMRDTGAVAKRVAQGLKANGKQGAEFFDQITRSGLKLLGIITAGRAFADFAKDTITSAAAQGRLATNLGLSTSALTAYGAAVKQFAGGNKTTAEATMGSLLQSYQQFKLTGQPDQRLMVMSRYLGLPISDLRHGNFNKLIGDLAQKMHGLAPQRAYAVGQSMGFDDGTINFLRLGRKQVEADLAKARAEGTTTAEQSKQLQKLQTAARGLETASETLGRTMLVDVAPVLTGFVNHLTRLLELLDGKKMTPAERKLNHAMTPKGWANTPEGHWLQHLFEGKSAPLTSAQRATRGQIMGFLMGKGLTRAQAAGVAGNALAESSFNPNARNGHHYGLWQWDEARRKAILKATGIDVAHAGTKAQLQALWWELTHAQSGALGRLKNSPNAGSAAISFDNTFERSGDTPAQRLRRAKFAEHIAGTTGAKLPPSVQSALAGIRAGLAVHHTTQNSHHAETHIGAINVHTQAKDAHGIAGSIAGSLKRHSLAVQANGGLS